MILRVYFGILAAGLFGCTLYLAGLLDRCLLESACDDRIALFVGILVGISFTGIILTLYGALAHQIGRKP